MSKRLTIAVIYGGNSPEHSISCISAASIMRQMDQFDVVPIGITRAGGWYLGDGDLDKLTQHGRELPELVATPGKEVALSIDPNKRGSIIYTNGEHAGEVAATVDLVLPVLHGPNGEDGTIQGLFEMSNLPYVGCGVVASATSMDKEFTKVVLGAAGLPIGKQVVLRPGVDTLSDSDREILGLPVFVKPARGGSSIGITKVVHWDDLPKAIQSARECDQKVIIEAAIEGCEVECGVLEFPDGRIVASEIAEICLPADTINDSGEEENFYDFDTKYLDDVISVNLPANVPIELRQKVRELAVQAFLAVDAKGLARVDFFLTKDGPVINEINTFPGFTSISMYPKMWEKSGVLYPELISTLIETEITRHKL